MSFDDDITDDIEIEEIESLPNSIYGGDVLATNYYDFVGPQQPKKPSEVVISETLREERKKLGRCVKCGILLPITIHGLQPCKECK